MDNFSQITSSFEKKILSVESELYLDSHRFNGTPYLPLVMALEYFVSQLEEKEKIDFHNHLEVKDLKVFGPIILRKDRPKEIVIHKEKEVTNESLRNYNFKITGNDRELVYFQARVELDSKHDFCLSRFEDWTNAKVAIVYGNNIYSTHFPHGPHFQNLFEVIKMDLNNIFVKLTGDISDNVFFIDKSHKLYTNPTLLDGLLQLCALHSIETRNIYMLPIMAESIQIGGDLTKVTKLNAHVKRISDFCYDVVAYNEEMKVSVNMKNIYFKEIKLNNTRIDN